MSRAAARRLRGPNDRPRFAPPGVAVVVPRAVRAPGWQRGVVGSALLRDGASQLCARERGTDWPWVTAAVERRWVP